MHAPKRFSTAKPWSIDKENSVRKGLLKAYLERLLDKQKKFKAYTISFITTRTDYKTVDISAAQIHALSTSFEAKINTLKFIIAGKEISLAQREQLKKGQDIKLQKLIDATAILRLERPKITAEAEVSFIKPSAIRPRTAIADRAKSPLALIEEPISTSMPKLPVLSSSFTLYESMELSSDSLRPFASQGERLKNIKTRAKELSYKPD